MVGMIQEWSKELEDLHGRIAHRFARPEPRRRALSYLKGLTGALERKNGWQLDVCCQDQAHNSLMQP